MSRFVCTLDPKGFPDAVKLLLFCEADVMKQDSEGCTPLHWAAIRGKAEAAHTLAQAGGVAVLSATDADGNTPPQLATDKGHAGLGGFLAKTRSRLTNKKGKFWREKGMAVACFALIVGLVLTFATRVMLAPGLPPLTGAPYFWSLCVIALASYGLYVMYKVSYCDPGFVKIGHVPAGMMRELDASGGWREDGSRAELTPETRRLHHPELKAGNWSALCTTCKIVKPWGVKHCSTTNRCVYRFDHYCPWMGNVIGKKNHRDFLIFLCLENAAMAISFCVALGRLNAVGPPMAWWTHAWIVIFLIWDACVLLPVLGLAAAQTHQAMENITTNELANAHRYAYLRDEHGKFRNPFDRGSKLKNLAGFCAQRNDEEKTQARWAMNKSEMEGLMGGGGRGGGDSMV
jgi:palmitoyltransferase